MTKMKSNSGVSILKTSISTLLSNKIILYPFLIIAFVKLLILEILYFIPRHPLKPIFGPIISTVWNESHLHYPLNLYLLPKLFQISQIPFFVFFNSFFIAVGVAMIAAINNDRKIRLKVILKETAWAYVHVVFFAALIYLIILLGFKGYELLYQRALLIRSTAGMYFILKKIITEGASYFNLLYSICVTAFLGYVIPIIICEKVKVTKALGANIKLAFRQFWPNFIMVFIPTLLYVPVLILRNSLHLEDAFPEFGLWAIIVSIAVTLIIEAVIYTAFTIAYILQKENR